MKPDTLETLAEPQSSDLIDSLIGGSTPESIVKSIDFGSIADISGVVGGFLSGFYGRFDYAVRSYGIAILPELVHFLGDIVFPESRAERREALGTLMTAGGKDLAAVGLAAFAGYSLRRAKDFYHFVRSKPRGY